MDIFDEPSSLTSSRPTIANLVATFILGVECLVGGVWGALQLPPVIEIIRHLGPAYFMTILGIWYFLAAIALLVPRFPLLKEWAYAGLIFNYTGAAVSHLVVRDRAVALASPIVFACLAIMSWALRPASRRMQVMTGAFDSVADRKATKPSGCVPARLQCR
jgi:DoxX-like family